MASSPEAPSGSSSSEDEFDLGGSSLKSSGKDLKSSESLDSDQRVSDDRKEEKEAEYGNTEGDDRQEVASGAKTEAVLSEKDKEMEDLFGSDYDSGEEEFKASYVLGMPAWFFH